MPNLDAVTSTERSSAPPIPAKPRNSQLLRSWDFLAVLILFAASLPLAWLSPNWVIAISIPGASTITRVLDATYKVTHHIYFGRDVVFLYARWRTG